jgi:hypothetical protein
MAAMAPPEVPPHVSVGPTHVVPQHFWAAPQHPFPQNGPEPAEQQVLEAASAQVEVSEQVVLPQARPPEVPPSSSPPEVPPHVSVGPTHVVPQHFWAAPQHVVPQNGPEPAEQQVLEAASAQVEVSEQVVLPQAGPNWPEASANVTTNIRSFGICEDRAVRTKVGQ